jgi:peptide/nickel transport system ATP-binding protein
MLAPATNPPVLEIDGLRTWFDTRAGTVKAVDGVSFTLERGEVLGLVGESGSGKSITGYSIMGVVDEPGRIVEGAIRYRAADGSVVDLATLSERSRRPLRGNRIAMILQDPMLSLNPSLRVGTQLIEAYRAHHRVSDAAARERAIDMLLRCGIPDARLRLSAFPHEFSGGMRQRVAIAMALINDPDIIIADEPTTALDVTTQAQILSEVQKLARDFGTAWIWITHDLGVVAGIARHVAVMYAGKIVEYGPVDDILDHPRHPYTSGLIASIPGARGIGGRLYQIPGSPPSLLNLSSGCSFRPRCDRATAECAIDPGETIEAGRRWRCWHPEGRS